MDEAVNYYQEAQAASDSMLYRLDGKELVQDAVDTLRGGVKSISNGQKEYYEHNRLMNELGIQRVRSILEAHINKNAHLTKYSKEERINVQIKSIMKEFVKTLASNLKRWAPEAEFNKGILDNPNHCKVRDKGMVVQQVEKAIYQSMLRGVEGFEALNTRPNLQVQQISDERQQQRSGGFFGMGRSRREYE